MYSGHFLQQSLVINLLVLKNFSTQNSRAHLVALSEAMNTKRITQNMRLWEKDNFVMHCYFKRDKQLRGFSESIQVLVLQ